jgi:hypothetical protein
MRVLAAAVQVLLIALCALLLLVSFLLSPYRYELDLEIPPVDEEAVELLRLLYGVTTTGVIIFFLKYRRVKSLLGLIMLTTGLYAILKFVQTYFL